MEQFDVRIHITQIEKIVPLFDILSHFSENDVMGVIHIRRSDEQTGKEFYTGEVTPDFLKDVFKLESEPHFLESESTGLTVRIIASNLIPNEFYVVEGPGKKVFGNSRSEDSATSNIFTHICKL